MKTRSYNVIEPSLSTVYGGRNLTAHVWSLPGNSYGVTYISLSLSRTIVTQLVYREFGLPKHLHKYVVVPLILFKNSSSSSTCPYHTHLGSPHQDFVFRIDLSSSLLF